MTFVTTDGKEWFICGWCHQTKRKEEAASTTHFNQVSPIMDSSTGRFICESCYRPITLTLSRHEAMDLHQLLENHRWMRDHLPENLFECTCEPIYEYDTNSTTHDDNCSMHIADHLSASENHAEQIISDLPLVGVPYLKDKE